MFVGATGEFTDLMDDAEVTVAPMEDHNAGAATFPAGSTLFRQDNEMSIMGPQTQCYYGPPRTKMLRQRAELTLQ